MPSHEINIHINRIYSTEQFKNSWDHQLQEQTLPGYLVSISYNFDNKASGFVILYIVSDLILSGGVHRALSLVSISYNCQGTLSHPSLKVRVNGQVNDRLGMFCLLARALETKTETRLPTSPATTRSSEARCLAPRTCASRYLESL